MQEPEMHTKILGMLGALALGLAACSPTTEEAKTEPTTSRGGMKMDDAANTPAPAGPIAATGRITAIDPAAGTVTLEHGPIPAVKWDAMTMAFTAADPMMLKDLKVGDAVSFELKSASEKTVITKIQKQ
jgi:Cu(I)/Ag(I) efflux system protein CusF